MFKNLFSRLFDPNKAINVSFSKPMKNSVAIYDALGANFIKQTLLQGLGCTVIHRRELIYYLSFEVLLRFIINKFFRRITKAYILTILQVIKPKVIVSFHINNGMANLSKYYKAKYYNIQNGFESIDNIKTSGVDYIQNLFCFGAYHTDLHEKAGVKVDKYYPVGSLKAGYYRDSRITKNNKTKYDICLVSQYRTVIMQYGKYPASKEAYSLLIKYLHQYLEDNPFSFAIALVSRKEQYLDEKEYYQNMFGSKAILVDNIREEFTTYSVMDQSDLVISADSTAGVEALGWGKKVFLFNILGSVDHSLNKKFSGCLTMHSSSYKEFSEKMDFLRKVSTEEYSKLVEKERKYLMNYDPAAPAHKIIRAKIIHAINDNQV